MPLTNDFFTLLKEHPIFVLSCWTFIQTVAQWIFSAYASSLRAPTAQSSQNYLSWFTIVNTVAGNWNRRNPPRVEDSPNFQAAVDKLKP